MKNCNFVLAYGHGEEVDVNELIRQLSALAKVGTTHVQFSSWQLGEPNDIETSIAVRVLSNEVIVRKVSKGNLDRDEYEKLANSLAMSAVKCLTEDCHYGNIVIESGIAHEDH